MRQILRSLTVVALAIGALSYAGSVFGDDIPDGPGKPPVFVKFFETMNAGDPPIELVRNGPVYALGTCPGNGPRIVGATDMEGSLARCTEDTFTTRWYPNGSGNPLAFLDPGDTCVIHNATTEADPFINTDSGGAMLVAPTGEVILLPTSTLGVAVHVLNADCVFIGVATLFTGSP